VIPVAVLAAGRGERFGGAIPKQLVPFGGRPLVLHAIDAARLSGLSPLCCVVSDDRVAAALPDDIEIVRNDEPERGISSSLRALLHALDARAEVDAVVVGLADQPFVGAEAYRRVGAAATPLAVATYGGQRANPVRIGREHWNEAMALAGDEGARVLFRTHEVQEVPCDGTGDPTDIDTPEHLATLEQQWRSQTASE
jgi:CTP:molybdopterin cytidylyltransferase MocA